MLARLVGAAEGDDLRALAGRYRQAGTGGDGEVDGIVIIGDIIGADLRLDRAVAFGEEIGGQDTGQPGQAQRGLGRLWRRQRARTEWPLERRGKVQHRIGNRGRDIRVDPRRPFDQHRQIGIGRRQLVGELQRFGAGGGNQDIGLPLRIEIGQRHRIRALDRHQPDRAVGRGQADRPAATQRIDGAGSIPPVHQKANSVMIGIWSDGFSQLRAGSTTRWATALSATSLVIHIWSRRRPRSDAAQSFAR